MEKGGSKHSGAEAIRLIDEQLRVLTISLGGAGVVLPAEGVELARKQAPAFVLGAQAPAGAASEPPSRATVQRVLVTNALLAVGGFLFDHDIANSRAPEIQFLSRVRDAIRNGNVLTLRPGESVPETHLGDLTIRASDAGRPLFCEDDEANGLMCIGDAVALLQRVADHLRGMRHLFSAGDAG
ncbi:hypothetical protein AWB81_02994 [Caballeronia arationis]|jgi:hypothetical protein|uniref:Uncharacterized protein n=1 Tax=Caballeronia arationis TaxID=1777142 RepID=A0A7Z7I5F1_9BURK|nr:hypothetical protein [Caballeronia arationis]SAK69480.1 hypothetical protein AWB81_02994 [Caballeronia arationis]SOE64694.1 hypothetical protein SAMN05446927_2778 [Caballeronia arationis]